MKTIKSVIVFFICYLLIINNVQIRADLEVQVDSSQTHIKKTSILRLNQTPTSLSPSINVKDDKFIFLIDNFDENSILNHLGGNSGSWEKDPLDTQESCAEAIVYDALSEKEKNKVLRLTYDVESKQVAYNGYWTRLNGLDLKPFQSLYFRVRGDATTGFTHRFKIELKTTRENKIYYVMGVKDTWQEVSIPLKDFSNPNNLSPVEELTIVFESQIADVKVGSLYFDNFALIGSQKQYNQIQRKAKAETYNQLLNLLEGNNDLLLDFLQKKIFQYFVDQSSTPTGLIKDRSTPGSPSSIAATGFGLISYCIAEKRGWLSRVETQKKISDILKTLQHADQEHGYFYHFLDARTGKRWADSEVSSIDTAILMAGIIFVAQYFPNSDISHLAYQLYENVDWNWMSANEKGLMYMAWKPEQGFEKSLVWNMPAEQMILYLLAIGSPTHPLPSSAWNEWRREKYVEGSFEFISDPQHSLFTQLYSQAFIDFRNKQDAYANYWENSKKCVLANREFCIRHAAHFKGYGNLSWGLSASDGPKGYCAYGAKENQHDGTLAPYAMISSLPFAPELVIKTFKNIMLTYGEKVWGTYGPVSAFNPEMNWFSHDHVGIDEGIMMLMIENYRSGFVWKMMMQDTNIQKALTKAGFQTTETKQNENEKH